MMLRRSLPVASQIFLGLFALALLDGAFCTATVVPGLDLPDLVKKSDVIAIGHVVSPPESESTQLDVGQQHLEARRFTAQFRIDQVLKGSDLPKTLAIQFTLPLMPIGYHGIDRTKGEQVAFLEYRPGAFTPANPYYPSIVGRVVPRQAGISDLDTVIASVTAVVGDPDETQERRLLAVNLLGDYVVGELANDRLRIALVDKDAVIRMAATAALLRRDDVSAIGAAEKALLSPTPPGVPQYFVDNVALALVRVTSENAIPSLSRILQSQNVLARRSATRALRFMGSREANASLTLAVTDPDPEVRYISVSALCEKNRSSTETCPSEEEFSADESHYLNRWSQTSKK